MLTQPQSKQRQRGADQARAEYSTVPSRSPLLTKNQKNAKKGQFRSKRQKRLARLPHNPPQQTNPDPNTQKKRQFQTKRPTRKKRGACVSALNRRLQHRATATPTRPSFSFQARLRLLFIPMPPLQKRKCLTPSVPAGSTVCAFF